MELQTIGHYQYKHPDDEGNQHYLLYQLALNEENEYVLINPDPDDDHRRVCHQSWAAMRHVEWYSRASGCSKEDLGRRLGITVSSVARWFSGKVVPSPLAIEKIKELPKE